MRRKCELFNRTVIGDKQYRRSRRWNEQYEEEELDTDSACDKVNRDYEKQSNDILLVNDITMNNAVYGNQVDITKTNLEFIFQKIDSINSNNIKSLKESIKNDINEHMNKLENSMAQEFQKQLLKVSENLKAEFKKEINTLKDTIVTTKSHYDYNSNNSDMNYNNNNSRNRPKNIDSYSAITKCTPIVSKIDRIIVKPVAD